MDIFKFKSIEEYFKALFLDMQKEDNRSNVKLTREWANGFKKIPGVYVVFLNNVPIYVGETGSLKGRMADLLNTKNHTLRRSIGERLFSNEKGYQKASSKISYIPTIEKKLEEYVEANLSVTCLPMEIGRKEFEEWIISNHPEIEFYNKRKRRK